ncbi:MAG: menaquinone biosynthesis decarboxylase, partial [Verrucomicrobiota bacterium]|nr:menaquinone biosynthesis decarboxylase [Verrucomicrobiota bacterium]
MAYESYADFLDTLEQAGELIRINEPFATELEITELADREMKKPDGGKAILIERPTVNGEISPVPLAINAMGSKRRMALALGSESVDAVAEELGSLLQAKPPTGVRDTMALLGKALGLRHTRPKKVGNG